MLYEHLNETCLIAGGGGLCKAARIHGYFGPETRGDAA